MNQYADYDFYSETYGGSLLDSETSFKRYAIEASAYLDEITLGRINADDVSDEVKMATCALAEINLREYKSNNEDQIASESVGPHSISYVKTSKTLDEYIKERNRIARMYLANTGLLYRGIPSWNL